MLFLLDGCLKVVYIFGWCNLDWEDLIELGIIGKDPTEELEGVRVRHCQVAKPSSRSFPDGQPTANAPGPPRGTYLFSAEKSVH